MKKKLISILITVTMLSLCACNGSGSKSQNAGQPQTSDNKVTEAESDKETPEADKEDQETDAKKSDSSDSLPVTDPSGAEISIPEKIESIVVLSPAISEIITALDLGDKVTGYDSYSTGIEGLPEPENVTIFENITTPDMEQLSALNPDILLVTNETLYDQENPYQALIDAGTCVICIPNRDNIAGIKSDIEFLADALGASQAGDALLEDFDTQLNELADIAAKIPEEERKRVYFEIAPAPDMYSCGNGSYLNEMLEWIGAENILADQSGWFTVAGETVVAANPDVIFTNVNYTDDPVQEILDRDGWADISAVSEKNVYSIDNSSSSHPNHNIIKAMRQMAEILYPDYYTAK